MQAIRDKVWKAVHRQRLCLSEKKRKSTARMWIPAPPRELWDVQGGVSPATRRLLFRWMVLKLTADISLEFVSSKGTQCDMPKYLLSESTVFTYLPVFKIFVKSDGKLQLIKFGPTHYTTCNVTLSYQSDTFSNFLLSLYLSQIPCSPEKIVPL